MTQTTTQEISRPPLSLLALMMAVGPFGDTEYTPAMPDIAHALGSDYAMVQLTMASYLFGDGLAEICYGPLSDRFGRRPAMLYGAGVLCLGALICLVSFAMTPLIAGRFIQGIGACAGGVIAKAAVRDAFPPDARQRVYAQLNAAFSLAPALGPVVGSLVAHAMNWHVNFAILFGLSVLLWILVWRFLPETQAQRNPRALEPARLWRNYKRPLAARDFMFYTVLSGCCIGVVYTALIGAPDLVINVLHRGSGAVVIVAVAILVGFVTGAGLCSLLSGRVRDLTIVAGGLAVLSLGSLALLAVALVVGEQGNIAQYLTPVAVCFAGVGVVVPVSTANAMAPFRRTAGAASSLLGFVRMMVAAAGTAAMSLLHHSSVYDMPAVFLGLSAIAVAIFVGYVGLRGVRSVTR